MFAVEIVHRSNKVEVVLLLELKKGCNFICPAKRIIFLTESFTDLRDSKQPFEFTPDRSRIH